MRGKVMPGNASKVRVGPGWLKIAPLATVEPVDLTAAWNVAWVDLGYTSEGSTFTFTPSFEAIEVAEELTPISYEKTSQEVQLAFEAAEMTAKNLQYAFNGGTITTGTGIVTFEPPAVDAAAVRVMIGWESFDKRSAGSSGSACRRARPRWPGGRLRTSRPSR
jgi:hypothetical protein